MSENETKGVGRNNPAATPGGPSGSKGGSTSKDKGKLYTDAEIHQIKTSAGAEAGRLRVKAEQERDTFKQDLESTTSRLDTLERDMNESRLAEARGDPDALRLYNREQAATRREREADNRERDLGRREEQVKSDRAEVDKDRGVVSIAYLAAKHGLEAEELESLGISDHDTLEKVAEKLAAAKPKGDGGDADQQTYQALETDAEKEAFIEGHPGFEPEGAEFTPDSGEGVGGGAGALTTESVEKMPMATLEKTLEKAEPKS